MQPNQSANNLDLLQFTFQLPTSQLPTPNSPMFANHHPEQIIKVLLVDDLRVVREKLKSVLQSHRDIEVIGTAIDGHNAIEQLNYLQPDIILLDLDMPKLNGMETAQIIDKKRSEERRVGKEC